MLRASAYPIEGILTFSGAELNPIFIIFSVPLIGCADTPVLNFHYIFRTFDRVR